MMAAAAELQTHTVGEGVPVVIIHGWSLNGAAEMVDLEPVFAGHAGFARIYVDLPGMGGTAAQGVRDLDDMLAALARVVAARVPAAARFLVAGSSCGGYLARALAHRFRDRVDGLLLRVPMVEPDHARRDIDPFRPLVADPAVAAELASEKHIGVDLAIVQTPAYLAALRRRFRGPFTDAIDMADRPAIDAIRDDPRRYRLSEPHLPGPAVFPAPTLILCGRQDTSVGYREAVALLDLYPRATLAVLDRETHLLPTEARATSIFQDLVHDWLDRALEWQSNGSK